MATGLLMRSLLLRYHLADFLTEHTLDFVLHCLGAGFAEMRPHKVGGLADFLHHRGWGVRLGRGKVMPAVALGSLFAIGLYF